MEIESVPLVADKIFGIHAQAMMLRSQRAEVLAANLANADTPGYKARDVDFSQIFATAQGGQTLAPVHLKLGSAGHISSHQRGAGSLPLHYRNPMQPSLDGNTVETQVEQAAFTQNALRYQASLRFAEGRAGSLLTAIRGE